MVLKSLKKDPSLADKAYAAIKSAIMCNELTPGTILAEENLASQLGISRTPLRAALQRLQHEEILTQNGKNMVVAEVTEREVRDICTVRMQLEPLAVHLLAQNGGLTEKQLDHLYLCGEKQLNALHAGDNETFLDQDALFHVSLAQLTGNSFLADLVRKSNEPSAASTRSPVRWPTTPKMRYTNTPPFSTGSAAAITKRQSRRFAIIWSRCSAVCSRNKTFAEYKRKI